MNYDQIEGVRWSRLRSMRISPLQYRHDTDTPSADTSAFRVGRATHSLILQPENFDVEFVVWSGTRRGKSWDAFAAEHTDRTILTATEHAAALGAMEGVARHPTASHLLQGGTAEKAITWKDDETGIVCKAKPDLVTNRLLELKTTRNLDARLFASDVARLGYYGQAAFYLRGLRANGFDSDRLPVIIAVENSPPHDVCCWELTQETVEQGDALVERLLRELAICTDSGEWPGAFPSLRMLTLPEWAIDEGDVDITLGGSPLGGL